MNLTDEQVQDIREKLTEIKKKMGAYNRDQLTHAGNVIESSAKHSIAILKILEEAEKK